MRKKVLCRRSYALGNVSSTVLALRCRVVPNSFSRDSCVPGIPYQFVFVRSRMKKVTRSSYSGGRSAASLPVSRKERGNAQEAIGLLKTPLPGLPNKSCCTPRGMPSWTKSARSVA